MAKKTNARCPLAVECERKCTYEGHELDCDYYSVNAIGDRVIEDQEKIRRERDRKRQEELDEMYTAGDCDYDYIPGQIVRLPLAQLHPHPENPRKDLGDLTEIAGSIKNKGILQNLTVVMVGEPDGRQLEEHDYTIIIGHRRRAGAELAGLTHAPCVIATMTPREQFETMMIENVQRTDLTVYEQAKGFQMMLDMGDSIEDVAKKTGFSASTIRRRSQLASLDEEKFRKTERRGASMEDYLKLSKISDPEARNKVLEKIGTAEFNNAYKQAIEDEKFKAYFADLLKQVEAASWLKLRTDEQCGYNCKYEYHARYNKNNQNLLREPEDAKPGDYIYTVSDIELTIYKRRSKKKADPVQKLKDKLKRDLEEIDEQLDQITDRHRQLRREFVKNFTAFSTNEMDITAFAAKTLAKAAGQSNVKGLGELLGIKVYQTNNYVDKLTQKDWEKVLFNQPLKALLCAALVYLDGKWESYNTTQYESSLGCSVPKHKASVRLDDAYDGLVSIGYEMAEEEEQMRKGTHPLFKKAEQLVETCKEDIKNAKKKASAK